MSLNEMIRRAIGRRPHLRRIADVIYPGPRREQVVERFLRQFPLTRRKYRDSDAWEAAKSMLFVVMDDEGSSRIAEPMVDQVMATMKRPTVGELKRALATDDCSRFRRRAMDQCARALREHPLEAKPSVKLQFDAYLGVLRSLSDHRLVPTMPHRSDMMDLPAEEAADRIVAVGLTKVAWMAELVTMAEAEVQARWDAALPPPAPATPSTRGRF